MSTEAPMITPYPPEQWWRRPTADDRPPLYWHIASRAFASAIRIVPAVYRFEFARGLSSLLAPIIKRTSWYGRHESRGINTPAEVALHHALNIMSNGGALFDLKMRVEGGRHVGEALSKAKGTIIVCPHSLLTYILIRYLHD